MAVRLRKYFYVVMCFLIASQCNCVFGSTSGSSTGKTNNTYKWIRYSGNYDKRSNGTSSDCDYYISGPAEKTIFYNNYYQKYSSSTGNIAKVYCECTNPPLTIEPGAEVSLQLFLHADIKFNAGKGMSMQGMVFFASPGLGLEETEGLSTPEYFKTVNSDSIFTINHATGFDDQNHSISAIMPKSTKEGEKVSIYFKTTAGVQEWAYQLVESHEDVSDSSSSTDEKREDSGSATSKHATKLTAKAKTFKVKIKTKKYTVTLKDEKGKAVKNVKLTLKVNKKTYSAKTNSKGKATFKIKNLTKKGKYTATIKFAGNKSYKSTSKKVKITVKK